jgi:hypothetical protein
MIDREKDSANVFWLSLCSWASAAVAEWPVTQNIPSFSADGTPTKAPNNFLDNIYVRYYNMLPFIIRDKKHAISKVP